ncbi:signal recognition particle-docking protein FtsY [candidate division KSB1 bacterium]|nr:signal recognition particle-docking protein FtsY [candidate division KSB1 bacterium]
MSVFGKLREKLSRTRDGIVGKIQKLVVSRTRIDEGLLDEIEEILIGGDVSIDLAEEIIDILKSKIRQQGYIDTNEVLVVLKDTMAGFLLDSVSANEKWLNQFVNNAEKPLVILVAGVNGTGKTTTIGKLANLFAKSDKKVLLAAADTFRAAAGEQLEIWAERAGVDIVRNQPGADPAAVAFDSLTAAIARGIEVLIVDTAGRLHTKVNLMQEITKIRRVLARKMESAPHEIFLVLDASTGQNGLVQAQQFTEAIGVTGLILTKLDGTAKGGVVFSIRKQLDLPVRFIGLGEGIDDLELFNPQQFVEALFQ